MDKAKTDGNIIEEDYGKYLLDKIDGYRKSLSKIDIPYSRVGEVLEFELEQFELRLFNFKKGIQSQKEDDLKLIDELLIKYKYNPAGLEELKARIKEEIN